MSILNPITEGGSGSWEEVKNTSATSTAISFPVSHEPRSWIVFRIKDTSQNVIYYIDEEDENHNEWGMNSGNFNKGANRPTGSYSNGVFTVTRGSYNFSKTVEDYVLIYI